VQRHEGQTQRPEVDRYSKTIHYEISGAGRIDFQYNANSSEGDQGDAHAVVKILSIDLGSH
jgi:hypothetical protein